MTVETYLRVRYGIGTDGVWWADSRDWPGWTVSADTRDGLMECVREAVEDEFPGQEWCSELVDRTIGSRGALGT